MNYKLGMVNCEKSQSKLAHPEPPKSPGGGLIVLFINVFAPLWGVWGAVFEQRFLRDTHDVDR